MKYEELNGNGKWLLCELLGCAKTPWSAALQSSLGEGKCEITVNGEPIDVDKVADSFEEIVNLTAQKQVEDVGYDLVAKARKIADIIDKAESELKYEARKLFPSANIGD